MKIVQILAELLPSGAEVMIKTASKYWLDGNNEVYILSTGERRGVYAVEYEKCGYKVLHLPFSKNFSFFIALYRLLARERFDVVHIHMERASFYIGIIALLSGVKHVARSIQNCFYYHGFKKRIRILQRSLLRRFGVEYVSVSKSVQTNEITNLHNPTTLISNWYDDDHFRVPTPDEFVAARQSLNIPEDRIVLLSIGNCSTIKNHQAIIKALSLVNHQPILYLHVGIEDADKSELLMAKTLNVEEKIRICGVQLDVRQYLWAANFYIMPSLHEGFSISSLEALGTGTSAILAEVDGLRDFKGFPGITWVNTDAESISDALMKIRTEPLVRNSNVETANLVKENYGASKIAMKYIQLYR